MKEGNKMERIVSDIISNVCYIAVTTIGGLISYHVKKYLESKKSAIEKQEQLLMEQLGQAQYNRNKELAIQCIYAVEQMGKEFNWEGAIKHSQATKMITDKTNLTEDEIFSIIKSVVGEMNKNKQIS